MNSQIVESQVATETLRAARRRRSARAYAVSAVGPATAAAGVAWALLQPYRLTILHPHGEGFWWLAVEPPLLVIAVAALFHFLVLPALLEDLGENE
jgi:hypothetical protein